MRKLVLSTVVMALALLTGAHLEAAQDMGKAMATLTGAAEVPGPGDPKGSGTVQVTLNPDTGEVCYELSVANIQEATAAHIHKGAMGQEGPVTVALEAPKTGSVKGCTKADAPVIIAISQDPAGYYVNVHNTAFPKYSSSGLSIQMSGCQGRRFSHDLRHGLRGPVEGMRLPIPLTDELFKLRAQVVF